MRRDEIKASLERAKQVLAAKSDDERKLREKAERSILPYPLYWLVNLGVASGLPPCASILILLQVIILFIPEFVWALMGIDGKALALDYPKFIQYFVMKSTYPNSMFAFWFVAPYVFLASAALFLRHIHSQGYQDFLQRRNLKIAGLRNNDFFFVFQMLIYLVMYAWLVFGSVDSPGYLRGFSPFRNRLAMTLLHGVQITLVVPGMLTLVTAEFRASFLKNFKDNKK